MHLIDERARLTNRLQAVLEDANIKLASVVTDVRGVSARAMLEALIAGETDQRILAELARGRLRAKRDALAQAMVGNVGPHHAFLLTEHLAHLDYLEDAIAQVSAEITRRLDEEREALALLDTIPGVSQRTAEVLLAEVGSNLSRFPSARHLAAWAGLCPGNAESGGRRLSGRTRHGNVWLKRIPVEIGQAAAKTKNTYLAASTDASLLAAARSALIAVGHSVLVIISHMLTRREPYSDLGGQYFDEREREHVQHRLVHRLERPVGAPGLRGYARYRFGDILIFRRGSNWRIRQVQATDGRSAMPGGRCG